MSRLSVREIQQQVAAVIDQNEVEADIDSDDYSLRLKYINMAEREWAETYDWDALYTEYFTQTSTATGNLSISLPTNFRKIAQAPKIVHDGTNADDFMPVDPLDDGQYGTTDKRSWLLGNPQDSYTLRVFGVDALASGATIRVSYFKSVGSLASPSDLLAMPNANFAVQKTIARVWEAREDSRFPGAKAEAETILRNMLEFETTKGPAYNDRIKTTDETRYGFRLGEG